MSFVSLGAYNLLFYYFSTVRINKQGYLNMSSLFYYISLMSQLIEDLEKIIRFK